MADYRKYKGVDILHEVTEYGKGISKKHSWKINMNIVLDNGKSRRFSYVFDTLREAKEHIDLYE